MNAHKIIQWLMIILSGFAALIGILSEDTAAVKTIHTVRGLEIELYAKGIYKHMSANVAIQGIAQDWVTLTMAIPLLLVALFHRRHRQALLLGAGTSAYFLVTYLFYTAMAMYNALFLIYVCLMGLSFFSFALYWKKLTSSIKSGDFGKNVPQQFGSWFLMINSSLIALLWLSIVMPPLFDGSIYPEGLQHYTTLIVQGFDLGLLLPLGFFAGWQWKKGKLIGWHLGPVYIVFLSILMTALSAKIMALGFSGVNVIPSVFIIPTINLLAWGLSYRFIKAL